MPKTTQPEKLALYMIGNAHIDPVWLWQWQEGYHEVKATFRSALDRMKEYDDFTFVSSSAAFYAWVEASDPAMFAEIQQRVTEGRWHLAGGWWIQPDCNLPGGESFVRHGLYAQRYYQEKFGRIARTGYNVDSFGHHAMLPQILLKSGLENYVFMRPMPHEKGLPGRLFWWESDDGSRVLTHRIAFEYGTWGKDLERHITRVAAEIKPPVNALMCFYGVGNHGGGPTKENLDSILRLNRESGPDFPELIFSSVDQYFDHMRAQVRTQDLSLPVVHDDLQHHSSGCFSAHSGIKRWNRQAENLLMTAEKWAVVAGRLLDRAYPKAEFTHAWKNVLFNQFHDILAGTSLEAAYEDARDTYGEAKAIAARALNEAAQVIAWNIDIQPEENSRPIVVFNPHTWGYRANVELEFGKVTPEDVLLDHQGTEVPMQLVQSAATANGRNRLNFLADLPALGYATYRLQPRVKHTETATNEAGEHWVSNGRLRLELDPETGFIASLRDLQQELEVFMGPAARPVVIDDPSDTWGHNVFRFANAIGEFKARSVRRVEHGPVKTVLRVVSEYGASRLVQDFALYRDLDRIDVHVVVDWREHMKLLKVRFPVNLNQMKVTNEIPYGHLEHFANGEEEPGQAWLDLSGISRDNQAMYGLSLLNDAKQSWDVDIRDIGLTVLRSPIYAHHIPAVPQPDGLYSYMDQGIQHFNYSLLPHTGLWEHAGTVRAAAEINQPPVALAVTSHAGPLPQREAFISVVPDTVVVSVLKQAEDDDAVIVRAYETARVASRALIRLPHYERVIDAQFGPCEIKTFRLPRDPAQPVVEVNLLEWQL